MQFKWHFAVFDIPGTQFKLQGAVERDWTFATQPFVWLVEPHGPAEHSLGNTALC